VVGRDSPNGATTQVEMVHPTNPDMICFEMNVPELLVKEASVTGFEIKEAKPPSVLGMQIDFQATKAEVLLLTSPVHKKFL